MIYTPLPFPSKSVNYVTVVQRQQLSLLRQAWLKVCGCRTSGFAPAFLDLRLWVSRGWRSATGGDERLGHLAAEGRWTTSKMIPSVPSACPVTEKVCLSCCAATCSVQACFLWLFVFLNWQGPCTLINTKRIGLHQSGVNMQDLPRYYFPPVGQQGFSAGLFILRKVTFFPGNMLIKLFSIHHTTWLRYFHCCILR